VTGTVCMTTLPDRINHVFAPFHSVPLGFSPNEDRNMWHTAATPIWHPVLSDSAWVWVYASMVLTPGNTYQYTDPGFDHAVVRLLWHTAFCCVLCRHIILWYGHLHTNYELRGCVRICQYTCSVIDE
jgi:hypothetical protein